MPKADGLIGRNSTNPSIFTEKVTKDKPVMEVVFHLLRVLVSVLFGGSLLDETVSPFDHSVGLGRIRLCLAMLNVVVVAQCGEGMNLFGFAASTVFESVQSELAPVVGRPLSVRIFCTLKG